MKTAAFVVWVIGVMASYPLIVAMMFHDVQAIWSDMPEMQRKRRREHLGTAMALAVIYAFGWPVLLPILYCLTGFAEHGIWSQK